MIDRLWRVRGAAPLNAWSPGPVRLQALARALERQGTTITLRTETAIEFRSTLMVGLIEPNWRVLAMFGRGRVWIEGGAGERAPL